MVPAFHRRARFVPTDGMVTGDMEDDFHRFGVDVFHDGRVVTDVRFRALRTPWTSCVTAGGALNAMIGLPLTRSPRVFSRLLNARVQCTHMHDLASAAVAIAAQEVAPREYDMIVYDPVDGLVDAIMTKDGEPVFAWKIARRGGLGRGKRPSADVDVLATDDVILTEPFVDMPLNDLLDWSDEHAGGELAVALYVMRRAVQISRGRGIDLELPDFSTPAPLMQRKSGACFSFQPDIAAQSRRVFGSVKDFSVNTNELLADIGRWIPRNHAACEPISKQSICEEHK